MVDFSTWIALMYFIRNNNSILFQQIKKQLWCIEVPLFLLIIFLMLKISGAFERKMDIDRENLTIMDGHQ